MELNDVKSNGDNVALINVNNLTCRNLCGPPIVSLKVNWKIKELVITVSNFHIIMGYNGMKL